MTPRMPPEWAPQDWLWIGFPHDADEWPAVLPRAQEQIAAFATYGNIHRLLTHLCRE